jgi:hypothetical protein
MASLALCVERARTFLRETSGRDCCYSWEQVRKDFLPYVDMSVNTLRMGRPCIYRGIEELIRLENDEDDE